MPAAYPILSTDEANQLCLVAYGLGAGPFHLSGQIVDHDGKTVEPASLALEERTVTGIEGYDKLVVTFRPPALPPGDYELRLALAEGGSPFQPSTTMRFRIGG